MKTFTVETNYDVYNISFTKGKMILTDSNCNYVTHGYFRIMMIFARERILSFQQWDEYGNCTFEYTSARKMYA